MKSIGLCVLAVCLCVSMSYASWQPPVFLGELNDYTNGYAAGSVKVSSDENLLLFNRSTPSKADALWEAHRNPETGVFDQQRQLAELKNGGVQIYGSWISNDKLRLYYAGSDPQNLGWSRRPIWMAIRSNPNEPWQTVKRHSELEIEAFPNDCTLTADEKCITYEVASWAGGGIRRIFTATRPSILHNFSNFREVTELEDIQAWRPRMSPDGKTVYFRILNDDGKWEAWAGSRDCLDDPFGDFAPIEELNAGDGFSVDPYPSADGQRLYYSHRPTAVFDINNSGIYVSEWVDDSYADAVRILQEAIAHKEQAVRLIQDASDKEQAAMQILGHVSPHEIPDGVSRKDIRRSVQLIRMALQRQRLIQQILVMNLRYLDTASALLSPPVPTE